MPRHGCSACEGTFNASAFSKNQLTYGVNQQRCKTCVSAHRPIGYARRQREQQEALRLEAEQRAAAELGIAESQWARRGDSEGRSRLICESVRGLHGTTGRRWMAAARRLGGLEHVLRTGSGHGAVLSLSWSQSGQLVGGCEGNTVLIWRTVVATEPNEGDALPPVPGHEHENRGSLHRNQRRLRQGKKLQETSR